MQLIGNLVLLMQLVEGVGLSLQLAKEVGLSMQLAKEGHGSGIRPLADAVDAGK